MAAADGFDSSNPSLTRSTHGQITSIRFADGVIGNLGEPLQHWSTEENEDTDEDENSVYTPSDTEKCSLPEGKDEGLVHSASDIASQWGFFADAQAIRRINIAAVDAVV